MGADLGEDVLRRKQDCSRTRETNVQLYENDIKRVIKEEEKGKEKTKLRLMREL
jgi:hypothetical protein